VKAFDLIYYCDGFPEIGMGHVFRGINIVNAYIKKHPDAQLAIQGKYHPQSINFIREQLNDGIEILSPDQEKKSIISIIDTMFYPGEFRINNEFFTEVKKKCTTLIFLWDVIEYNVPKEVDIVINHLPYAKVFGDSEFKKYVGLKFAPIPSVFYESHEYKLNNGCLLSILGATTKPNSILPLLKYIEALDTELEKIVIVSPSFDEVIFLELIKDFKEIEFKKNVPLLSDFIKNASVIITTYGSTTFQAMASKIPTFTIAFQDFQNVYGAKLEGAGFCVNLGLFNSINKDKLPLLLDVEFKSEMHKKLKKVFKTPGMDKITNIISEELQILKNKI